MLTFRRYNLNPLFSKTLPTLYLVIYLVNQNSRDVYGRGHIIGTAPPVIDFC